MRDDKKRRDIRLLPAPEPCLKTLEVLRERGYAGGKRAVYALVQRLRPRETRPLRRFEGLAGEFSQHDFGEMRVEFADGRREQVRFFASRLNHPPFASVTPMPDRKTETLVRVAAQHFARFGGVPLLAVFDFVPQPDHPSRSWTPICFEPKPLGCPRSLTAESRGAMTDPISCTG